jgi:chemotaxis protein methyltransferase CheR
MAVFEGDFEFHVADFRRVRTLIYQHAGIVMADTKQQLVYSRLSRRLRALGLSSFKEYLDALESGQIDDWQDFVNALTTNLTAFFREPHHFPVLAEHLRRANAPRPQRIWCSAASTGEEPYSIAMTAIEALGARPAVQIIASDIDTHCLRQAQDGVFPLERAEKLPSEQLRRHFLRGKGARAGLVRIRPEVQSIVRFHQVNLLQERYPFDARFDAIFCRNVMIYFDKPTQLQILQRFASLLAPDGLLFCGHSENFTSARDLFRLRGKTVYELARLREPARAVA